MSDEYPSAERVNSGHAIRYIKSLMNSEAIRNIGMEPVLLCVFIASREDKLHYLKPPQFWRAELMERLGIGSPKAIVRIRKAAVDAGLLYHIEGDRIHPGKYWTRVPDWLEPTFQAFRKRNGKTTTRSVSGTDSGTDSGTANGTANGTLSNTQYPVPSTNKEAPSASSSSPRKTQGNAKFDPLTLELPKALQSDRFRAAWGQWVSHRAEIKKPITPTMASTQLRQFAQWGESRAVAAITHTIAMGWQGLREPTSDLAPGRPTAPTTPKMLTPIPRKK